MKHAILLFAILGLVSARPQAVATGSNSTGTLVGAIVGILPQLELTANDAHDLTAGTACKEIYFLMARGSGEWGTLGLTIGPVICRLLKEEYKDRIGCDGLGPAYTGGLGDNVRPKGTTDEAINEGVRIFNLAHTKCPNSLLTFGGFSQGAAVMHNVIPLLSPEVKKQVIAGVLWGDTKNKQTDGKIEGYPKEQTLILCTPDDGVCWGRLDVTAGHLAYLNNGDKARSVAWLKTKIDAAVKAKGAAKKLRRHYKIF
ncbi:cutinase-domain-containing protein [Tothia fuscella]|uniref:cutinase n=1 Tax=Tothia fuscella TaxID=1048955 RepID=A0A9P4NWU9_9PEZI|nr:cutinase-domain-containing protein [Tothia fuscella]